MQKPIRWLITLGWFSAVLLAPISVRADETVEETVPLVFISEIAWAGSNLSNADEWIELVSLETETIDISNWILTGAGSSGSDLSLPDGSTIEPNSTYLISNYDQENEKSVLAVEPNYVTTAVSLSNSALGITLTDELGAVIDSAGDGSAPSAGSSEEHKTMTRVSTEDGTQASSWIDATESIGFDPGATELGTPGSFESFASSGSPEPLTNDPYDPDPTNPPEESEKPQNGDEDTGTDSTESTETETPDTIPLNHPTGTLIINEFVSDPVNSNDEWIEIWNPYNNVIDLAGWTVQDGSGTSTNLPEQLLGMHQFAVISAPKGKLNNSGDTISLFDPSGNLIDEIHYGTETIPAVDDPNSTARADDGTWSETESPTPGWINEIIIESESEQEPEPEPETTEPTPTDPINSSTAPEPTEEDPEGSEGQEGWEGSYDLRLISLYPNTNEGDATSESITVQNIGSEAIKLDGWQLADASKEFGLPDVSIDPNETLTFYRTETNLALNNNGGETVSIIAPNGVIADQLTYEKTKKGYELVLGAGGWTWQSTALADEPEITATDEATTDLPTEPINMTIAPPPSQGGDGGGSDEPTSSSSIFESSLEEVRAMARGTEVRVTGTVSVEPGRLGRQVMYLAGSGIQIYFYRANWPELERGDTVTLTGELVESYNETRIKISSSEDILVVGHTKEPVAHQMNLENIHEEIEGWLVNVSGMIQSIDNDRLILEDDGSSLKVIAKEGTGIAFDELNIGDEIQITGIVSQYYDEYRLLPRDIGDIEIVNPETAGLAGLTAKEQAQGRRGLYAAALSTLVGIILLALAVRYRSKLQTPKANAQKLNYNVVN